MIRITRMTSIAGEGSRRATQAWQAMNAQPSWIARTAMLVFLIVVGLPIALLLLFAIVLAGAVFAVLVGANLLLRRLRSILPGRDGRENVRIIPRGRET